MVGSLFVAHSQHKMEKRICPSESASLSRAGVMLHFRFNRHLGGKCASGSITHNSCEYDYLFNREFAVRSYNCVAGYDVSAAKLEICLPPDSDPTRRCACRPLHCGISPA